MERRLLSLALAFSFTWSFVGCGGSETPPPNSISSEQQPADGSGSKVDLSAATTPEGAVKTFLEATKQGDAATIKALFTKLTVETMTKSGRPFNPSPRESLNYLVGEVVQISDTEAHVGTASTEFIEGESVAENYTYVLKREGNSWRVSGMMAQMAPNLEPEFYNFEDPATYGVEPAERTASDASAPSEDRQALRQENPFGSPTGQQ